MKFVNLIFLISFLILGNKGSSSTPEHQCWASDLEAHKFTQSILNNDFKPRPVKKINANFFEISVNNAQIKSDLEEISGAKQTTLGGQTVTISERRSEIGRAHARVLLSQKFQELGFSVATTPDGNFIAEKLSSNPNAKFVILSSHIDSVGNAGANDDGLGTVSALEIARNLQGKEFNNHFRYLGFDKEESGLVGSRAYVAKLSASEKSKIIGAIQLEMMGTNKRNDGGFHVIDCQNKLGSSDLLTAPITSAIGKLNLPLKHVPGCTDRSDHASFWKAGMPAVVVSENFFGGDSDPCYHRSCDKADSRINYNYAAAITKAVGAAVIYLLN